VILDRADADARVLKTWISGTRAFPREAYAA
jgi:hypothetical protein